MALADRQTGLAARRTQLHLHRADGAIANALNLAHRGVYEELQTIAPGETWRESVWVRPTGFTGR